MDLAVVCARCVRKEPFDELSSRVAGRGMSLGVRDQGASWGEFTATLRAPDFSPVNVGRNPTSQGRVE